MAEENHSRHLQEHREHVSVSKGAQTRDDGMRAIRIDLRFFPLTVIRPTSPCPVQYLFPWKLFTQAAHIPSKLWNEISLFKCWLQASLDGRMKAHQSYSDFVSLSLEYFTGDYLWKHLFKWWVHVLSFDWQRFCSGFSPPEETVGSITQQRFPPDRNVFIIHSTRCWWGGGNFPVSSDHIWAFWESKSTEVKLFSSRALTCMIERGGAFSLVVGEANKSPHAALMA